MTQLSPNLTHGFLSNFARGFPWAIRLDVFLIFEKRSSDFYEYFSFSLTCDPMGAKISKHYSSYKSQPKAFKLFLIFFPNGPHKITFGIFEILSFWFLTIFFENSKFTIVAYGEIKTWIIWKTSYRRAKPSEIWDSWVVNQHIRGTFGLLAFNVILISFSALAILRNLGLMIIDRRIHFGWLWELSRES